jgi:hypothetical protein
MAEMCLSFTNMVLSICFDVADQEFHDYGVIATEFKSGNSTAAKMYRGGMMMPT